MSNEIYVFVYCEIDVLYIFLSECRKVDMHTRNVYTLACPQFTFVLYLSNDCRSVYFQHFHSQCAIVKQDVVTHVNILCEIAVCEVNDIVFSIHFRSSENLYHISDFIFQRTLTSSSSYLRALCVDKYANMMRHASHVSYYLPYSFRRGMGSVNSHHVHTCLKKVFNKLFTTSTVADGSHNLSLFHCSKSCLC